VSDTQAHIVVDAGALAGLVRKVLEIEGVANASISVALVDDATIHVVNRRHLAHDWPTDVISFRLSGPEEDLLVGELVVSGEMAAVTAREVGVDPTAELALYVVHGLLHLCGYDDQSPEDIAVIRRREEEILTAGGWTYPHSLRGQTRADGGGRESARWSV
jgi:probable rRNA maturation factor